MQSIARTISRTKNHQWLDMLPLCKWSQERIKAVKLMQCKCKLLTREFDNRNSENFVFALYKFYDPKTCCLRRPITRPITETRNPITSSKKLNEKDNYKIFISWKYNTKFQLIFFFSWEEAPMAFMQRDKTRHSWECKLNEICSIEPLHRININ